MFDTNIVCVIQNGLPPHLVLHFDNGFPIMISLLIAVYNATECENRHLFQFKVFIGSG